MENILSMVEVTVWRFITVSCVIDSRVSMVVYLILVLIVELV